MTENLISSLKTYFGFSSFRPGQEQSIHNLLNQEHTLAVMPTGSGKSLIFQLAALLLPGLTLVVSPLIALMKDQVDSLERRGIPATFINSTLIGSELDRRLKDLASGAYRIVYIAPERLRSTKFIQALKCQKISLLAVDEAHCISEWGHDFRPDYLHIARFRAAFGNPLTVALTATATPKVQDDIVQSLGLLQAQRVVTGFNRSNLAFEVRYTKDQVARLKALRALLLEKTDGAAIIYTGTRRDAEEVGEFVSTAVGIQSAHYHAGLPPEQRTRIQDEFMSGALSVVVATNAFGMGIDRPDVRQVIHYSLPGSLEAYYQEAGRAGRDELPARAVLLYSTEDRALQEWFIANSAMTRDDLRLLYQALSPASNSQKMVLLDDLSCLTGLPEIKLRVGLSELERAGILEHFGDQGLQLSIKLNPWQDSEIQAIAGRLTQHQVYRKSQLQRMITYAESNTCRRVIILRHFGDTGPAEAKVCCDNCQALQSISPTPNPPVKLTHSEQVDLIILEAVRRLPHKVGKEKIIQILKGSRAKDILEFGYDQSDYYGKLTAFSRLELKRRVDQLLERRYLKVVGGKYPILGLTPQAEAFLHDQAAIDLPRSGLLKKPAVGRKQAPGQATETVEYTARLLVDGLTVEQIAARRGLSPKTIYSHAAKLIVAGRIEIETIVSKDVQQAIEAAILQVGSVEYLYPIKILLPEEIDYNVIRCVVESWKLRQASETGTDLPTAQKPFQASTSPEEDPVAAFLSQSHPRPLLGPWQVGWALGFHSQFSGADWKRSKAGELAYRLKYQGDVSVLPELVEQAIALIAVHPELAQVDAVIPVPPSTQRPNDPVSSFAVILAQKLGVPYLPVLVKSRITAPQKEMHTLAQKRANTAGAFNIKSSIRGQRVLIVDDLYDSGATLDEITRLIQRGGALKVNVLTLTRTIHSDA
jgi:ATP-dependent DNA helicase RecQ